MNNWFFSVFLFFSYVRLFSQENDLDNFILCADRIHCAVDKKQYQDESRCYEEIFVWGQDSEILQKKIKKTEDLITNESHAYSYEYDLRGNIIVESFFGNLSGRIFKKINISDGKVEENGVESYRKYYKYSDDGLNLLLKKQEDNGLVLHYFYKPKTKLLVSKIVSDKDSRIIKRHFFEYNDDNILIRVIEDDGSSFDKEDLSNVNILKIKVMNLKKESPAINLPESIEEKYYDNYSKKEISIGKKVLHYSANAEVIQEDIYDSNNDFCYSIFRKFNDFGKVIEESNPYDQINYYDYDDNGNLIYEKKASSDNFSTYYYDQANRLIRKEVHTSSNSILSKMYIYDDLGRKTSEKSFQGLLTIFSYDKNGNISEKKICSLPDSNNVLKDISTTYKYDGLGREIFKEEANGDITKTLYNSYGMPIEIIYSDKTELHFVYNLDGTLQSREDQEGCRISFEYDVLGRETKKVFYDSSGKILKEESTSYNGFGIDTFTDPAGSKFKYYYDGFGRKIREEFISSDKRYEKKFFYDSLGRLYKTEGGTKDNLYFEIFEKDFMGHILAERIEDEKGDVLRKVCYEYDSRGNRSKVIRFINNKPAVTSYAYDDLCRIVEEIDPCGNSKTFEYEDYFLNQHGQKVSQIISIDPLGVRGTETLTIDGKSSSIKKVDKNGILLSFEESFYDETRNLSRKINYTIFNGDILRKTEIRYNYGPRKRITSIIEGYGSPHQKSFQYTYTKKGFLETTTKPDGVTIKNKYDCSGNLVSLISSDGSCKYSFEYDSLGRILRSIDENSRLETSRTLDSFGNTLKENLANGLTVSKSYDDLSRVRELIFPDGSSVEKLYNALDLIKVTRKDEKKIELYSHEYKKYDLAGNIIREKLIVDEKDISRKINSLGRLSEISSDYLTNKVLKYDPIGRISEVSWNNKEVTNYSYDLLGQLIYENGFFNVKYGYDSQLNRLYKQDSQYEINDINQIVSSASSEYFFDLNGSLISKKTGNETVNYIYDALDRLIEIEYPFQKKFKYEYDSFHRRIFNKSFLWDGYRWVELQTIKYLYDGQDEIGSYDNQGRKIELRILGLSDNAEIGAAIALEFEDKVFAPIHDLFHNVTLIVSFDSTEIAEEYRFSSFGEEEKIFGGAGINPWRYLSKRKDSETNFLNFGRRFYDPEMGRWISTDPKGYINSYNLYSFVFNDPLHFLDLYGMDVKDDLINEGVNFFNTDWMLLEYDLISLYNHREMHFDKYSSTFYDGIGDFSQGGIFFINGIAADESMLKSHLEYLSQFTDGDQIVGICNMSNGWYDDLQEFGCGKIGFITAPVLSILLAWKNFFDQNKTDSLLHICHSQGATHTKNALIRAPQEWRDRIAVVNIAGGSFINEEMCKTASNYVAKLDVIPFFTSERWYFEQPANLFILNGGMMDHEFQSSTYNEVLKTNIDNYLKMIDR